MTQLFDLLAVGLFRYVDNQSRYPLPDTLQQALNGLSACWLERTPASLSALLRTFEQPLDDWWPADVHPLPDEIDSRFGLLDGTFLDEQLIDYLEAYPELEKERDGLLAHGIVADNQLMRALLVDSRSQYSENPVATQHAYQAAREFVIRHPVTTPRELNEAMRGNPFRDQVTGMYLQATSIGSMLEFKRQYWVCRCGILYSNDNELGSVNPAWCRTNCPGEEMRRPLALDPQLRILRRGIQLRTMLPGLAEIELYDQLVEMVDKGLVAEVSLWPGVDLYDLRIVLPNGSILAVDVKDYRSPIGLANYIMKTGFPPAEGTLAYTDTFFVVPSQRVQSDRAYLRRVHQRLRGKHVAIEVLTADQFIRRVIQYSSEEDR